MGALVVVRILQGDCREILRTLPSESVHTVVTSPPYWGLRDYGVEASVWPGQHKPCWIVNHAWGGTVRLADGSGFQGKNGERFDRNGAEQRESHRERGAFCQICGAWRGALGLEPDYRMFVDHVVEVFAEVRRVLRSDGTCWLNLGDSYATGTAGRRKPTHTGKHGYWENPAIAHRINGADFGLKPKDLCGVPWRVAFALQDDGWWLRQDIIWAKPNPMPESVTDRCTKSHEYMFLLAKSGRYYFDQEAILEPFADASLERLRQDVAAQKGSDRVPGKTNGPMKTVGLNANRSSYKPGSASSMNDGDHVKKSDAGLPLKDGGRNKRSVWEVTTQPFSEAHFATFPPALIEPCILAGCPKGGTVLDPFGGAGTTGLVADRLGRDAVLIELNPEYADMARKRISGDCPMFSEVA